MSPQLSSRLSGRDALLAVAIVFVWGTNFVVIRLGLNALPPLFFATLRFLFVLLPACFFLKRPRSVGAAGSGSVPASDIKYVPWSNLAIYGVAIGLFQFGILFIAMQGRISPGLASLVVQMQVFFTIGLSQLRASARGAMLRKDERLKPHQWAAFALALSGMGVIAAHNGEGATLAGVALVLVAAMGWAFGNQAGREAGKVNMLAYVVWAALFAVPPLLTLSLLLEGPAAILNGIARATPVTWAAVLWQSVGNTMFGYACWAWLLSRYPAATVAPMSLLVPVFGFGASAVILHEPLPLWKIGATLLIMGGLAVNLLWVRRGQPKADETVQWTVSSDERRELGRAAGGASKSEIGGEPS